MIKIIVLILQNVSWKLNPKERKLDILQYNICILHQIKYYKQHLKQYDVLTMNLFENVYTIYK